MSEQDDQKQPANDVPKPDDASGADEQSNGGNEGAVTFASQAELQRHIDDILKDRLAREARKREDAERKAREQAEAEALTKNQEWQKLAEQHAKRIVELEPLTEQVEQANGERDRYRDALTTMLNTQRDGLPAPIIALLDKLDPIEQLTWIAENRETVAPQNGRGGIPQTPKADGRATLTDEERRKRAVNVRQLW